MCISSLDGMIFCWMTRRAHTFAPGKCPFSQDETSNAKKSYCHPSSHGSCVPYHQEAPHNSVILESQIGYRAFWLANTSPARRLPSVSSTSTWKSIDSHRHRAMYRRTASTSSSGSYAPSSSHCTLERSSENCLTRCGQQS
jgi:hypothetical protein